MPPDSFVTYLPDRSVIRESMINDIKPGSVRLLSDDFRGARRQFKRFAVCANCQQFPRCLQQGKVACAYAVDVFRLHFPFQAKEAHKSFSNCRETDGALPWLRNENCVRLVQSHQIFNVT